LIDEVYCLVHDYSSGPANPQASAHPSQLPVVYQDDSLLVVVKWGGMPSVPQRGWPKSAACFAMAHLDLSPLPEPLRKPAACHRLDVGTSGLLCICRTVHAARFLATAFETRQVRKTYRALVCGMLPTDGLISTPLDNKEAETRWKVVQSDATDNQTLVDLFPKSGRKHQLRRHLAGRGNPIVGDCEHGHGHSDGEELQLVATELIIPWPAAESSTQRTAKAPTVLQPFSSIISAATHWDEHLGGLRFQLATPDTCGPFKDFVKTLNVGEAESVYKSELDPK
jgi:23S rRNA-/tRNA-specific pseudouridylate synthase